MKLKAIRTYRGLTRNELAEMTGLKIIRIRYLEYHEDESNLGELIKGNELYKLAKALDVEPEILLSDKELI